MATPQHHRGQASRLVGSVEQGVEEAAWKGAPRADRRDPRQVARSARADCRHGSCGVAASARFVEAVPASSWAVLDQTFAGATGDSCCQL
jgi:hypothetical protein